MLCLGTIFSLASRDINKFTNDHVILTRKKEEEDTDVGIGGGGKSGFGTN